MKHTPEQTLRSSISIGDTTIEEAMEQLQEMGYKPKLICSEDSLKWQLVFLPIASSIKINKIDLVAVTIYVSRHRWKDTIREALLYAMDELIEE